LLHFGVETAVEKLIDSKVLEQPASTWTRAALALALVRLSALADDDIVTILARTEKTFGECLRMFPAPSLPLQQAFAPITRFAIDVRYRRNDDLTAFDDINQKIGKSAEVLAPASVCGWRARLWKIPHKSESRVDLCVEVVAKTGPHAFVIKRRFVEFRARVTQKPDVHGAPGRL